MNAGNLTEMQQPRQGHKPWKWKTIIHTQQNEKMKKQNNLYNILYTT